MKIFRCNTPDFSRSCPLLTASCDSKSFSGMI